MDETLKELVVTTLNIPTSLDFNVMTYPSCTIDAYNTVPSLYGDGKAKCRETYCQLDLWYKDKTARDTATEKLLTELEKNELFGISYAKSYDSTTKIYRTTFKFSYKEENK